MLKITVITVCYNAVQAIERTMLSVIHQTYSNIEYIIIDGGSTDGTQEIIARYSDRLAYWVSEPDGGIYEAMNKGLSHATGQWVNFMNVGDVFADANVVSDVFAGQHIDNVVKVIVGDTIFDFKDRSEMSPVGDVAMLVREIPFCHQSCFTKIEDDMPWRFDTRYHIAADYDVFYHIFRIYGSSVFLKVRRTIARYDRTESYTYRNFRKAKKEYLKIQSAYGHGWWWKEWLRLARGVYK